MTLQLSHLLIPLWIMCGIWLFYGIIVAVQAMVRAFKSSYVWQIHVLLRDE